MRIALVAPPFVPVPPMFYGGTELVVDMLARGYQAEGHEVVLYTTGDSTCPVPRRWVYEEAEGMRIGQTEPELRHVVHAYQEIREGYDIVHDHTLVGPAYAQQFPNVRLVTTVHNPLDDERIGIYRDVAEKSHVVAVSEAQRRSWPDLNIARVIHHGVDAAAFPFSPTVGDYCLFLGRMALDKGASHAIRAAKKAGCPLILVGKMRTNPEHAYFEERVRPHLGEDVEFLGEVSYEKKLELLSGARALLFPIRWNEPFGLVMLESLACGTPVLATPYGAVPEVVEDGRTGFLTRDETDMAEAIASVGSLNRADCRSVVEGYFSAKRMVADYLALFQLLANPT